MRRYAVNEKVLLAEDATSFYLLGLWMTDGNIADQNTHPNNFHLGLVDRDHMVKIRDLLCPNKPLYERKRKGGKTFYHLSMNNEACVNWLQSYGCVPRKTYTLTIRRKIPDEFLADFIRGLIDGDGSISAKQSRVYLCSASLKFMKQMLKLMNNKMSITSEAIPRVSKIAYTHGGKKGNQYRITIHGRKAQEFLNWIYYPDHTISMRRKNESAIELMAKSIKPNRRSSEEYKSIMALHDDGFTASEISEELDMPLGTVTKIITRFAA
jgi:hypothetical protein